MTDLRDILVEAEWMARGSCVGEDPDMWFPHGGTLSVEAKRICAGCDVRLDCLEYAIAHPDKTGHGIWGGLTEKERRQVRRRRRESPRLSA